MTSEAAVAMADRAARHWRGGGAEPIRIGSEAHKELFCRMLLDTFNPYKPAVLDWPKLDPEARDRLVSLPIWDIAVQTEGKAKRRVMAYADRTGDPLLKEAVSLNGFEEGRHKDVLSNLVEAYGITLAPEPPYLAPRDPEWAFMVTGFGVASVLMLLALATYVAGSRYLPPDRKRGDGPKHPPLTARDYRIVGALILLSALAVFPSIAYYQEANAGLLLIEQSVARELFGWSVPASAFNALDGFFCIVLVPPLVRLWRNQSRRGREPGDLGKIAIGFLVTALANFALMLPAGWVDADPSAKISMLWPVLLYGLNALGFLYYWPTMLALFSRAAPAAVNATLMGVLFFSLFFANVLIGTFGGWWETMTHARFFAFHAALALVPCAIVVLLSRPFGRLLAPVPPAAR